MNKPRQTKAERRTEAREKARQMREEAERRAKRRRVLLVTVTVVAVLALVLGIFAIFRTASDDGSNGLAGAPEGVGSSGEVVVGQADAPVTVDVYLDYQCPACKAFEDTNAELLNSYVEQGDIKVAYHPISILDRFSSGTRFSTRAAAAAFCVAPSGPEVFSAFNEAMFANQPPEGETGMDDAQIVSIAKEAGASDSVEQCITGEQHVGLAQQATERASADGLQGTPWVKVEGEEVSNWTSEEMTAAIDAALADQGVTPDEPATGSPTATASPTDS